MNLTQIKLDEKNKRALVILLISAVLIACFNWIWLPWRDTREELHASQKDLQRVRLLLNPESSPQYQQLARLVPAFKMPQAEDRQRLDFERSFSKQLQDSGLNVINLPQYTTRGQKVATLGVRQLQMKCRLKGDFNHLVDFLARLYDNPYLVSIEELKITKKDKAMEVDITVSTYVK